MSLQELISYPVPCEKSLENEVLITLSPGTFILSNPSDRWVSASQTVTWTTCSRIHGALLVKKQTPLQI